MKIILLHKHNDHAGGGNIKCPGGTHGLLIIRSIAAQAVQMVLKVHDCSKVICRIYNIDWYG